MCFTLSTGSTHCYSPYSHHQPSSALELPGLAPLCGKKPCQFMITSSCATQHPEKQGATACTSCPASSPYFTIIDPKTQTGTCSKTECPFCKPKACCGKGHKHYVVNTKSMEGVCVRHNDDCSAVCSPRGDFDPRKDQVCTKGCNQLVKKKKTGKKRAVGAQESEVFDMVVCQTDKRVHCPAAKKGKQVVCSTKKWIHPVAVCSYVGTLWNLGATCLANHLHGDPFPDCPPAPDVVTGTIKDHCRLPTNSTSDRMACQPLAVTF